MKIKIIITGLVLFLVFLVIALVQGWGVRGFNYIKSSLSDQASVNCLNKGGNVINKQDENGGKYSICQLAGGAECEVWAYLNGACQSGLSLEYAKNSAEVGFDWITNNASTYIFDGFNLAYQKTDSLKCPYCFAISYSFSARHSGLGDRTGQKLDQVITKHATVIKIEAGKIIDVVTDGKFSEILPTLNGEVKSKQEEIFSKASTIDLKDLTKLGAVGRASLGYYEGKTYCRVVLQRIVKLENNKYYQGWLVNKNTAGQFFSLGQLSFNITNQAYQLDFVADGNKTDYRDVAVTTETKDNSQLPSDYIMEGAFATSTDLEVSL